MKVPQWIKTVGAASASILLLAACTSVPTDGGDDLENTATEDAAVEEDAEEAAVEEDAVIVEVEGDGEVEVEAVAE